jgi:hypothetical protein
MATAALSTAFLASSGKPDLLLYTANSTLPLSARSLFMVTCNADVCMSAQIKTKKHQIEQAYTNFNLNSDKNNLKHKLESIW